MAKSLCIGKRVKPNKCKKLKGCNVASGKNRTYCRKIKNKTTKHIGGSRKRRNKTAKK